MKPRPFQVSTLPLLSTSTQNDVVAQETELSWPWVSASPGWVQVWPFHTEGPPSAATQKVGDTHEIWLAAPHAPRLPDQPEPSNAKELPSPSMVMQKVGPVQSMAVMPWAAGMVAGACHADPLKSATWFRFGAAAQKPAPAHERYETPWGEGDGTAGPSAVTLSRNSR